MPIHDRFTVQHALAHTSDGEFDALTQRADGHARSDPDGDSHAHTRPDRDPYALSNSYRCADEHADINTDQ